jgi:C1A family cysteine protease
LKARATARKPKKGKKLRKGFGWLPDIPDARDHTFRPKFVKPISKIDLREFCPPVEDQGNLGSCTANALVSALEFLEIKHNEPLVDYSRLFVYYNERVYINTVNEDSGAIIRDGIKSLNRKGVCPEAMWNYDISKFTDKPTKECYNEGRKHKTVSYQRINTFAQMKACLQEGHPFVFGFAVYDSFWEANDSGIVPMPNLATEEVIGGHAVLCVGFDNATKRFLCQNSWGTDWGQDGYFTMPYEYMSNKNLADDFWVIRF